LRASHAIVNTLVVAFALFFTFMGLWFILIPITHDARHIEGGPTWDKAFLGLIFLLAAAPMYYYVFAKSAKAMPPPRPRAPKPPA